MISMIVVKKKRKEKEEKRGKSIYTLVKVQPVQQQQLVIISADKTRVGIERRTKTMDTEARRGRHVVERDDVCR